MSINFPNSPANGQQLISNGKTYTYNSSKTAWKANLAPGFDSGQVVSILNQNTVDSSVVNSIISNSSDIFDSSQVISLVSTNSNKVYTVANMAALVAVSGMSTGDQALVIATSKVFIYNGTGWYIIATITNGSPSAISGVDSDYVLATDGTPTIINAIATDPEGAALTWSSSSSGLTNEAAITQGTGDSSNYFTVTPSTTLGHAGTFTLTIAATDGINGAVNWPIGFTLSFIDWSSLSQQAKIVSSSISASDKEGYDVRIRGDRAIQGAPGEFGNDKGAAYVFHRSGSSWSQISKITPPSSNNNDACGESVAISSTHAVVGVPGVNKVEVWLYNGSTYTRQVTLSGPAGSGYYGNDVAIEGDYIFVGDSSFNSSQGRAYVYYRSGTSWNLQASLDAGSPAAGGASDQFGSKVRADSTGSTLIIGAWAYDYSAAAQRKGAVYVFTRSGTTWTQRAVLEASDGATNDYLGTSIAINETGDTVVAGAPNNDTGGTDSGKVYVFTGSGASWSQQAAIQPSDITSSDLFGFRVGAYGNVLVASAREGVGTGSGNATGTVYIFQRSGSSWSQSKKFVSSDIADGDRFGWSVDLDQSSVIVGARDHDHSSNNQSGGTYVFTV